MPNTPASDGAFGSRGSRQMGMQACPLGPLLADIKCPSIYPKFQRGLYNMFQLKKVKMRKMGKRKPPYESNHTKVTCSHYVVFIP